MGHVEVATRWNLNALEDAYQRWRHDPQSVDPSWRYFFEGFELGADRRADVPPLPPAPRPTRHVPPRRQLRRPRGDPSAPTRGVDSLHTKNPRPRRWLQERMEPRRNRPNFDRAKKLAILKELHYAEMFERFLHTRYVGQKR